MAEPEPWTPGFVDFLREVTAESVVIRNGKTPSGYTAPKSHDEWRLIQTAQRLDWLYGSERAAAIMGGRDPATNADLAAWNGGAGQAPACAA